MTQILTGDQSAIPGHSSVPFDCSKLPSIVHYMQAAQGVVYGLGSKPLPLPASPPTYNVADGQSDPSSDCSGFARYAFWHATGGIEMPDGSVCQNDWLAQNGFKHDVIPAPVPLYTDGLDPKYVYLCFCRAGTRGETIGHVWYIMFVHGQWWTFESHGGAGPSSRLASTLILAHICTDAYPIAVNNYGG